MKSCTLGYFKAPRKIYVDRKAIRMVSKNEKEVLFYLVSTYLHEIFHYLQFVFLAHGDITYWKTNRHYHMICEHQAYYLNRIIAKIMHVEYDYKKAIKLAWTDYTKITWESHSRGK